jgi:hypothetical protein
MPAVRFRGPSGQPGLQFGEVINEVVNHPPDRLVRGGSSQARPRSRRAAAIARGCCSRENALIRMPMP